MLKEKTQEAERAIIFQALVENAGNKTRTAKALGVVSKTLDNKITAYAINMEEVKAAVSIKLKA